MQSLRWTSIPGAVSSSHAPLLSMWCLIVSDNCPVLKIKARIASLAVLLVPKALGGPVKLEGIAAAEETFVG